MGRTIEAKRIFEQLLHYANHLGLYSEEIDPDTGSFLGNFPQAFSHMGLIMAAHELNKHH
jgi:GH15 family glucan-1,4-alpha-glucosidase